MKNLLLVLVCLSCFFVGCQQQREYINENNVMIPVHDSVSYNGKNIVLSSYKKDHFVLGGEGSRLQFSISEGKSPIRPQGPNGKFLNFRKLSFECKALLSLEGIKRSLPSRFKVAKILVTLMGDYKGLRNHPHLFQVPNAVPVLVKNGKVNFTYDPYGKRISSGIRPSIIRIVYLDSDLKLLKFLDLSIQELFAVQNGTFVKL